MAGIGTQIDDPDLGSIDRKNYAVGYLIVKLTGIEYRLHTYFS